MNRERELLERVLESRTFMQGVALRREIEQLLAQPEQTEQFPLPGERLIEMWRDGYDAGVRLAQPEHIPDVGNMVTQEPVYWENEKKALLNEIDHLTNRLAQPDSHEEHELGVETYFSYEDSRYPILVLRSEQFGSVGYNLDLRNGDLSRVCLCHAHSENECLCGAWSIDDE